jgi:hypothetical protein
MLERLIFFALEANIVDLDWPNTAGPFCRGRLAWIHGRTRAAPPDRMNVGASHFLCVGGRLRGFRLLHAAPRPGRMNVGASYFFFALEWSTAWDSGWAAHAKQAAGRAA